MFEQTVFNPLRPETVGGEVLTWHNASGRGEGTGKQCKGTSETWICHDLPWFINSKRRLTIVYRSEKPIATVTNDFPEMEESSELEEIGVYHVWFISSYDGWWWSTILGQYNPGKKKTPGLLKYCSCVFNAEVSSKICINTDTVQPTLIAPLIAGSFGVSAGLWSPSLDQHQRRRSNEFPLGAAFSSCQCPIFFGRSSCTWLDGFPVHNGPQTMPFTTKRIWDHQNINYFQ